MICVCIASRGRPESLWRTIETTDDNVSEPGRVWFSVALDEDDEKVALPPQTRSHLIWDLSPREDTLGGKYNRCQQNVDADLYVLNVDDIEIIEPGWDEYLRKAMEAAGGPSACTIIFFGYMNGGLMSHMALTRGMVDALGYFMPPYFPTWWHDTWIKEIAELTGRGLSVVGIMTRDVGKGGSIGVRDVSFWQARYDSLEIKRIEDADRVINIAHDSETAAKLRDLRPSILERTRKVGEVLRDPGRAMFFEKKQGVDAPDDARYRRIKKEAGQHAD